jgi:hypothetical protein
MSDITIIASFFLSSSEEATYLRHVEKQSKGCVLRVLHEGKIQKLLMEHVDRVGVIKLHPKFQEMDLLWCCNPQRLDKSQRAKHLAPPEWSGKCSVRYNRDTHTLTLFVRESNRLEAIIDRLPTTSLSSSCAAALQR